MTAISTHLRSWAPVRFNRSWQAAGFTLILILLLSLAVAGCSSASAPESSAPVTPVAPAQPEVQPAATETVAEVGSPAQPTEPLAGAASAPRQAATSTPEAAPAPTATPEPLSTSTPEAVPPGPADSPTAAPEPEVTGGGGFVIGEGSKATFTVNETLAWLDLPVDAVMNTTGLSGVIFLDGQATVIELDLHSMTSDQDRRDGYVRNRMFPDHPTATFTVTDLGDLPDPLPEGEVIARQVQGELTIMDVTKPIVFEVEARIDPDKLFVLGRTTFTWQELEIPPPNIPGRIQVKDEVRVEVLLSAVPNEG